MRNLCPAHGDESLDLRHVQYRHDAADDRIPDPHRPRLIAKAIKILVVQEELCNDKITASVDLALQVLQIAHSIEALRMTLRIACHTDAEVVAIAGEGGQLIGKSKSTRSRRELRLPCRRIAAQRQHIANPRLPKLIENRANFLGRMSDAGEMSHRADLQLILNARNQIHRLLPRRSAGAVGY